MAAAKACAGRSIRVLLVVLAVALALLQGAAALDFPALTGRVVDDASLLDIQTRDSIRSRLAELEAKTTDQLVVVTVPTLAGTPIEQYGYQLGRHWQIGQRGKNNGVLLIVAPTERAVRIEVGYGLEGTLTDAISKLIIENSIIPRIRANDFPGAITRGVEDIIQVLTGGAPDWKRRAEEHTNLTTGQEPRPKGSAWPTVLGVLFVLALIALCFAVGGDLCFVILDIVFMVMGSKGSSSSSSGGFSGGGGSFGGGGASGSW